jgi:hypothetical protein
MNDAKSALESQDSREKWSQLVQRAATDNDLKQRLLTEPTPVLEAEGVGIPEGSRVQVTEENGQWQCVIETPVKVSAAAAGELSAGELSSVVGGGGKQTTQSSTPTESVSFNFSEVKWTYQLQ